MTVKLMVKKIGMTSIIDSSGLVTSTTILQVQSCVVVGHKTVEVDGYESVLMGYGEAKSHKLNKAQRVFYEKNSLQPKIGIKEFRTSISSEYTKGSEFRSDVFIPGQFVDVHGVTIGKGFAGAMKRHGFGGLRASHGVSVSHRSHGSTGGRQDPGKVFKNKKMAGHMGAVNNTIQNLKVLKVDSEKNLVFVKGSVPGHKNSLLVINNAVKKAL
jgi:large subunit ribosomal protein L3